MCILSVSLLSFVLSGIIMELLVISVDFNASFDSPSIKNVSNDSLAVRMQVNQLMNYLAVVPSPQIDVTNEELNRLWNVPSDAEISPGMQAIGRCRITLERRYHKDTNKNICNRIEVLWPKVVFVVALFNFAVFLSSACMKNAIGWAYDTPSVWQMKMKRGKRLGLISSMAWFATLIIYFYTSRYAVQDVGLFYKSYGQIYPNAYYEMPIVWNVVLFMCLINYLLKIIETFCFCTAQQPYGPGVKNNEESRLMEEFAKKCWKLAEQRFRRINSNVPPKTLQRVVEFCKSEYTHPMNYLILQRATPTSSVFIEAIKTSGIKRSKK